MNTGARMLVLLACASLPAAAGPPPPVREAGKPWNLDYGATACVAIKRYGTDAAPVTLALRPSPSGRVVRLTLHRPGSVPAPHEVDTDLTIAGAKIRHTALRFAAKDGKDAIVWINVPREELEGLRRDPVLAVRGAGFDERLALPGIGKVLDGLDACDADLRAFWNMREGAVAAPAEPMKPLRDYFSPGDYPFGSLRRSDTGRSGVVMMIDAAGTLSDCMVEETSGIASLDAMTCSVLFQHAKFRPARDAAGKPIRSVLTTRVNWRLTD